MNNDDDDLRLVNFLRQHQPIASNSSLDLEDRIIAEINSLPQNRAIDRRKIHLGMAFGAIAASIGGFLMVNSIESPQMSLAEIHGVETYIESHWEELIPMPTETMKHTDEIADLDRDLMPEINIIEREEI
jgi:hypothetical protein